MIFSKPARRVKEVFIHCSASDNPDHDNICSIEDWHIERGFQCIGYHFFIDTHGGVHKGRDLRITPASQKGHNEHTISICVSGLNDFTENSLNALKNLCEEINTTYNGDITFHGHCEVNKKKTCPVFNYKSVLNLDRKGRMIPAILNEENKMIPIIARAAMSEIVSEAIGKFGSLVKPKNRKKAIIEVAKELTGLRREKDIDSYLSRNPEKRIEIEREIREQTMKIEEEKIKINGELKMTDSQSRYFLQRNARPICTISIFAVTIGIAINCVINGGQIDQSVSELLWIMLGYTGIHSTGRSIEKVKESKYLYDSIAKRLLR